MKATRMKAKRAVPVIALVGAAALGLAGCSGTSDTDASSDEAREYTVMVIQPQSGVTGVDTTMAAAVEAAIAALDEADALGGATIDVISCDPASDPNKSVQCARDAVSEGVLAVVGSFDPLGVNGILPVLESADIPWIGPLATQPIEFTSPVSFPVTSGAMGGNASLVVAAVDHGCEVVGTWGDRGADGGVSESLQAALESEGIEVAFATVSSTATDVTPAVSQVLAEDPDCLLFSSSGIQAVQIFKAARGAGSDAQIISSVGTILPPYLESLGADADGAILTTDTPLTTDDALADFRDQIAEYATDVEYPTAFTLTAWYGAQVLAQALEELDGVATSASLLEHLGAMGDIELPGMATFSFSDEPAADTDYPRMFNPTATVVSAEDGAYIPGDGEWFSVVEFLPAS